MGSDVSIVNVGITTVTISDDNCTVGMGLTDEASAAENRSQVVCLAPHYRDCTGGFSMYHTLRKQVLVKYYV